GEKGFIRRQPPAYPRRWQSKGSKLTMMQQCSHAGDDAFARLQLGTGKYRAIVHSVTGIAFLRTAKSPNRYPARSPEIPSTGPSAAKRELVHRSHLSVRNLEELNTRDRSSVPEPTLQKRSAQADLTRESQRPLPVTLSAVYPSFPQRKGFAWRDRSTVAAQQAESHSE